MLAASGSLRSSQIQMLHDLVLCDVILVDLLMVLELIIILMLDLSAELGFSLLLRNFETTREAAPFLIQKLRDLLLVGVLNLVLHVSAYFWNLTLWIQRTHAKA